MKKPKYAELEAQLAQAQQSLSIALSALQYMARGTIPEAVERFEAGGWTYIYEFYGRLRVDGGILIIKASFPGQLLSVFAYYWEEYQQQTKGLSYHVGNLPQKNAVDRLAREIARMNEAKP